MSRAAKHTYLSPDTLSSVCSHAFDSWSSNDCVECFSLNPYCLGEISECGRDSDECGLLSPSATLDKIGKDDTGRRFEGSVGSQFYR